MTVLIFNKSVLKSFIMSYGSHSPLNSSSYFIKFYRDELCVFSYKARNMVIAGRLFNIGPSGVRALPLAAGINEGGHYWSEWLMTSKQGSSLAALS